MRRPLLPAALVLLALAAAPPALATGPTTHVWTGGDQTDSSNWTKAQNWDDNQVPQDFDAVIIAGRYRVDHVPDDKTFTSVTLSGGAVLSLGATETPHGPLQAVNLTLDCADLDRVDASTTGLTSVLGGRLFDATITVPSGSVFGMVVRHEVPVVESGCADFPDQEGTLLLQFSSHLVVDGLLHGDGSIEGGTGVPDLTLSRSGTIGAGSEQLTLNNLTATLSGAIAGTGVRIAGHGRLTTLVGRQPGDAALTRRFHLEPDARLTLASTFPPGTGGTAEFAATGVTNLGARSRLVLGQGANLTGTPSFEGGGTLALVNDTTPTNQPPTVGGTVLTAPSVTLELSGDGPKAVRAANAGVPAGAGALVADGPITLKGRGAVQVGVGKVDLHGNVTVPAGAANAVTFLGGGCCAEPVTTLTVHRTATIGRGAVLRVQNMRLDLRGTVTGDGALSLVGGSHRLGAGAKVDASTTLRDGGVLTLPAGTVTLTAPLRLAERALLVSSTPVAGPKPCGAADRRVGWCEATIAGDGSIAWRDATVKGYVTTGRQLGVDLADATEHRIDDAHSLVEIGGRASLDGSLPIAAGARLTLDGAVTLFGVDAFATSCCTPPRALLLVADGATVNVARNAAPALRSLWVQVSGDVYVRGYRITGDSDWDIQPLGRVLLDGGRVATGRMRLHSFPGSSVLVGPGRVEGDVENGGRIRFAKAGELRVVGDYAQTSTGVLQVPVGTAARSGRLWVLQDATLGGIFDADPAGAVARGLVVLRSGSVSGRFAHVLGLPARRRLGYAATTVRVLP